MSNEIVTMGLVQLSDRIGRGELSSTEVTRAFLDRLDALQADVHPMASIWRMEALRAAAESDERQSRNERKSALDGVPMTIKESIDVRGTDTTLGVQSKVGKPALHDAVSVRVLREAGCVFLGKTNISQFLLFHECSNPVFGRTNNPFNKLRAPGGSSGGEAAAIAAYGSPVGLGTDIGGSIRVPAHFCGIAGFKPTVDRISGIGVLTALKGQEVVRGQCGPMARNVDDLALMLRVLSPERCAELDPRVAPLPLADFGSVDVSRLTVGYFLDDGLVPPSAALRRAVLTAADSLRQAGAKVVPFAPVHAEEIIMTYLAALSSDGGETVEKQLQGGPADDNILLLRRLAGMPKSAKRAAAWALSLKGEPLLPAMLRSMGRKSSAELWALTAHARGLQAKVFQAWRDAGLDAVLCPPHATPALPHGASKDFTIGGSLSMRFNFVNFPAGVVPVTTVRSDETTRVEPRGKLEKRAAQVDKGSEGLPVGVQVVALPFREDVALAVMKAIESTVSTVEGYPRVALR